MSMSKKFWLLVAVTGLLLQVFARLSAAEVPANQSQQSELPAKAALSAHEPIYFIVGGGDDIKARFQISFKYRVFDEDSGIVRGAGWMKLFHFAYTQTSLWNLSADSAPFEDTSYRPSFYWDFNLPQSEYLPKFIRAGYEHESNGQGGGASRSINTFFVEPFWGGKWHGRDWIVAPKFYAYLSKGEHTENIDEYRGYVDLGLRYGNEDDWMASATLRPGYRGRSMMQLDLSYPVRKIFSSRAGGYIYLQIFHGYGETLLSYNEHAGTQIRLGLAVVR